MKATIDNQSQSAVAVPGYAVVQPGKTLTLAGLNVFQASHLALLASRQVIVSLSADPADKSILTTTALTPTDPVGGVKVLAACGFIVKDAGTAIAYAEPVVIAAFDDAACTVPSVAATLNTASKGTITAGAGTNSLEMTIDTGTGEVALTLTVPAAQLVYLKAGQHKAGTHLLDASGSLHKVTFT